MGANESVTTNTRFNEAEASLPRNTVRAYLYQHIKSSASMRPRQACLGIRGKIEDTVTRLHSASMRPRQACLGIRRSICALRSRYNRFNEAEASLPRNTVALDGVSDRNIQASMRPRQACLGILRTSGAAHANRRGFNEAEASLPRNTPRGAPAAGRGECFNEAEASLPRNTSETSSCDYLFSKASMRPRQACLGIRYNATTAFVPFKPLQ